MDLRRITAETRSLDLSFESPDYIEWLVEAETQFRVTIPDRDSERMTKVGDFLGRSVRTAGQKPQVLQGRASLSSHPMRDGTADS